MPPTASLEPFDIEPDEPPAKSRPTRHRRNVETARLFVHIPLAIDQALRERAVRERRSLSDAVTTCIEEWLGRQ